MIMQAWNAFSCLGGCFRYLVFIICCCSLSACIDYQINGALSQNGINGECIDGIDNDHDGWVDDEDPDCTVRFVITELGYGSSVCNDGIDNDGDGFVDADDASCADALGDTEGDVQGEVIITEFLANPAAVTDNDGEWIELYNTTSEAIDLHGWILQDSVGSHVIGSSVLVPARAYIVISKSGAAVNGLPTDFPSVYVYGSGITLSNSGDTITLLNASGILINEVQYASSQVVEGSSLQMDVNDVISGGSSAAWCLSQLPMTGSGSDNASPGQANVACGG